MTLRKFHNNLRILRSIDRHDLVGYGVMKADDDNGWRSFNRDPFNWFIRAPDEAAEKLWSIVQARQPKGAKG